MFSFRYITIFPDIFKGFFQESLMGKAAQAGLIEVGCIQLRDFADPPHYKVDDTPYGGGAGMVMLVEPLVRALENVRQNLPTATVLLLSASGRLFEQSDAERYALAGNPIVFICGRYEGVDERLLQLGVDEEISIGNYVLMGGEVAAMVATEAIARLIPGVLGNDQSLVEESFGNCENGKGIVEGPQYSKPADFRGLKVPEQLLSGHHKKIEEYRCGTALEKTKKNRPELLKTKKK